MNFVFWVLPPGGMISGGTVWGFTSFTRNPAPTTPAEVASGL